MGRPRRSDEAGTIYHRLNHADRRATIFHKPEDYVAILVEGLERSQLELLSYCLMTYSDLGTDVLHRLFGSGRCIVGCA